jgi:hypothetical protein
MIATLHLDAATLFCILVLLLFAWHEISKRLRK